MNIGRIALKIFLVLALGCLLPACERRPGGLNAGQQAPELQLTDLQGRPASLSSFRGKVVLLNFWASWCGSCLPEMPALEKVYKRFKEQGLEIVAVASDDEIENVRAFQEKTALSFSVLFDGRTQARSIYLVSGYPESFFIDRNGKLIQFEDQREPMVRVVGPREWDTEHYLREIERLLKE